MGMHGGSVVVGADDAVYWLAGQWGGDVPGTATEVHVSALREDGTPKWPTPYVLPDLAWNASPAIGADGNLYLAGRDRLVAVDGDDGSELWSTPTEGAAFGTTIGPDGAVTFQTDAGLYSVCSASGGLAEAPWPKRLHDSANSGNALH